MPKFARNPDGTHTVRALDCRAWAAVLKATVPLDFREWDPRSKVWSVWLAFDEVVAALMRQHFGAVDESGRACGWESPGNNSYRVPHSRETAPRELIQGTYRILARHHRPDLGGDGETMRRINGAYGPLKALAAS